MKIAIVQMTSGSDLALNLKKMKGFVEQAAAEGAEWVAFPEMAYFMGKPSDCLLVVDQFETLVATFCGWAKQIGIGIFPGSLREPSTQPTRFYNTALAITPAGQVVARYRKIFLFKASLPDREYDEGTSCDAGKDRVVFSAAGWNFGMTVCFDVRFAELYRALKAQGAQCLLVPSAFTVPTGQAHWETLLRARAIENQCYVVAPAQVGQLGEGRQAYGHALVVDPWGQVMLDMGLKEGVSVCDLKLEAIGDCEKRVAIAKCRRDDLFSPP